MSKKKGMPSGANLATAKRLLSYMGRYKGRLVLVILFIIISGVADVGSTLFVKNIVDGYIMPLLGSANPDFSALLRLIILMAAVFLAGIISNYLYNRLMITVCQGSLKTIRDEMFSHMQKLPIRYFDTHPFGDVMSCYTNDTDALRQMISQGIPQIISSIITVTTVFFAMLFTNVWLTAFVVVCSSLLMLVIKGVGGKSAKYFILQQQSIGRLNGFVEEMISGQKVVKVFNHEEKAKTGFGVVNEELRKNSTKANKYANILMPIMGNLANAQYVLVAVIGGTMFLYGETHPASVFGVTVGTIIAFIQLSKHFVMPISRVSQQFNSIIMALAGASRIFAMLDEEPEVDDGYVTLVNAEIDGEGNISESEKATGRWAWKHPHGDGTVSYTELRGDVRMTEVDFEYVEGKPVLHDVTLFAEPGQKVAFVGATGAGKTTITNLINRFYDIADGKIRYDGININKIRKDDLRRSLGVVLQDVNLFTGTVMENIRYGRLDATDEECIAAAKRANAHGFIMMLPNGYETVLSGDGSGLSQGQRQLISIARAAVADPPVMILDEATSSIDTRTEAIVQKGMDALMQGRTVFVIAHRLSTVMNSDVIMVLEHGRIIERGSHEQLIEKKGKYYQLYTGAFELE